MSQHSLRDANAHTQSMPALQRKRRKLTVLFIVERALVTAMLIVGVVFVACMIGLLVMATLG